MYIVTGGAGFIGSAFVSFLNQQGIDRILIVDQTADDRKSHNLDGKRFVSYYDKESFLSALLNDSLSTPIKAIIHLGANSSTTETNRELLHKNNFEYSKHLAEYSLKHNVRYIYASSASVYGDGSRGFSDDDRANAEYQPLNAYGQSKHLFDTHVINQGWQNKMVGLRFFNVYGPNEYHKFGQFSVVYKAYQQVKEDKCVRLFKSYRNDYHDGEQKRDFVYVKDCCQIMWWLLNNPNANGILNIGYGKARSWNDLAHAVFAAFSLPPNIQYIEMPEALRGHYQYFTEANIERLRALGYQAPMTTLEDGVQDYIRGYLEQPNQYY